MPPRENEAISYFEFQSEIGHTKHIGGLRATEELLEMCRIKEGSRVLEVGCGVGMTSVLLAKKYGCTAVGIDINEGMVNRARERAEKENAEGKAEFMVADAQALPFRANTFDAVICESVNAFIPQKQEAVKEYVRVARPGGWVGFNEACWIREPDPELEKGMRSFVGAELLSSGGWASLLERAGLEDVVARNYRINMLSESMEQLRRFELLGYLKVWWRTMHGLITKRSYRNFVRAALKLPKNYLEFWGYGIYAGRKPLAPTSRAGTLP